MNRTNGTLLTGGCIIPLILLMLVGCGAQPEERVGAESQLNETQRSFLQDIQLSDPLNPVALIDMKQGLVAIEIYEAKAPVTARNFIDLVMQGFYDGLRFHLVQPGFAVQTGDPTGVGTGNANIPGILLETHPDLRHDAAGIVGMARLKEDRNSATSQFYILLEPQPSLDDKYAVFGSVVKGLDAVNKIARGDKINNMFIIRFTGAEAAGE
jgi:peptidyl-prolyl cis-trans isomerase B (cyclophilin B)